MKKITKNIRMQLAALAVVATGAQMADAQCNSQTYLFQANNCTWDYITNVTFHTLTRNSACDNPFAVFTTPNPTVTFGQSYTLSVSTDGDTEGVRAWIDYNQDGVFDNVTELVLGPLYAGTVPATYSTVVTIPMNAKPGVTRLRVRCNWLSAPTSPTATQNYGETEDYCVTIEGPPCVGTPPANSINSPTFDVCQGSTLTLATNDTYTLANLTYQWQSSTISPAGLYFDVPSGGNEQTFDTPPANVNTWYQLVVVCPNQGTLIIPGGGLMIASTVTNDVKYVEDFELIGMNDRLPNCSWSSSSPLVSTRTFSTAQSDNRIGRSGSGYAVFANNPGTHEFITNGVQLEAGVTYSVSMWYQTDMAGSTNWSNLRISLNNTNTSVGATQIAGVPGSVISPSYKSLSNTFSVTNSGLYHFVIEATGAAGGAPYLVWDDFEVMIPCTPQLNAVTVNASATNADICSGQNVTLNASGSAHTYTWSNGKTGASVNDMPMNNTMYTVMGTNTITSCGASAVVHVTVRPTPLITIAAIPPIICAGESANLVASGGLQYQWSSPGSGSVITVAPSTSSSFSVTGTAANLCQMSADVFIKVNDNPVVNANTSEVTACAGDAVELSGMTPGLIYEWTLPGGQALSGSPILAYLYASGVMTLSGTDANGCEGAAQISLEVETCTGINAISQDAGVKVYPNPASADFTVESKASISEIQIADLTGRVVSRTEGGSTKVTVATGQLAKGIYQVRVTDNDGTAVIRLVKE